MSIFGRIILVTMLLIIGENVGAAMDLLTVLAIMFIVFGEQDD